MSQHDKIADRLYGLPLDEFTAARNQAAKELRARGARDEADSVAKLAKPTVPAWAVNQLARERKPAVRALLAAGGRLAKAQARGGAEGLRDAARSEREAVEKLVEAAEEILTACGQRAGEPTLQRVRDTLHAAAVDEDVREVVRSGRLVRELQAVGFGATMPAARPRPGAKRRGKPSREARAELARIERDVAAAHRRLERAEADRDRAAADVRALERRLADAKAKRG